jgi:bacterioferritin
MATGTQQQQSATEISLSKLVDLLNERLSREYHAIRIYGIFSQIAKRAVYKNFASEIEKQAQEKLQHALLIANQIHSLGGIPEIKPRLLKRLDNIQEMLRFELQNKTETIGSYRELVRQCEAQNDFALAEQIGEILLNEQQHQIDLATALGHDLPDIRMFL